MTEIIPHSAVHETISGSPTLTALNTLSLHYLEGAKHFAAELKKHEDQHKDQPFGSHWHLACHLATACFMLAFAAIEAGTNEAAEEANIPDEIMKAVERAPLLERTQAMLVFKNAPPLAVGAEPVQSFNLLRRLRNALVHFKPEWSHELDDHKKMGQRLIDHGLRLHPSISNPDDAFPLGCMSHGVSDWAVNTAEGFLREVSQRLGTVDRVSRYFTPSARTP